jgi:7,8-dihydro-6-hydroxymethylpterin dimethyltransferase
VNDYLTTTLSTCATCARLVPARIELRADGVWFHKQCPDHGPQEARVAGDAEAYQGLGRFHRPASQPLGFSTAHHGCPDSCGLCPEHEQHVCLPILEITDHCNLDCPICLVRNPGTFHRTRAEVGRMLDGLLQTEGQIDVLNLSGGEPTLHPHFRDIVEECVSRRSIVRVSVSTNGLTLSQDPGLLRFLAERQVIVSLQFDGLSDDIYRTLRGRPLLKVKRRLIDQCAALDMAMSLTATVASGVNLPLPEGRATRDPDSSDKQEPPSNSTLQNGESPLQQIAGLLFEYDHVLSAMFQPAAYAGNAAKMARPPAAATIADIIANLRGAGQGTVSPKDFSPLPCSHPACFALAFYLKLEDRRFTPVKSLVSSDRYLQLIQNRAIFGTDAESFRHVTGAVYDLWSGLLAPPSAPVGQASRLSACAPGEPCACSQFVSDKALKTIKNLLSSATASGGYTPAKAWRAGERSVKSIFIHQFMDRHTFDLSRARKCCQVYPQPDGRLMPACVYNCLKRP